MMIKCLVLWAIVCCVSYSVESRSKKHLFGVRALGTMRYVTSMLGSDVRECIFKSQNKSRSLGYMVLDDTHLAIAWIHMYTMDCSIPKSSLPEDKDENKFPFRLNKELRCMNNTLRNPEVRGIFLQVSNVIEESLRKMRPQIYNKTYRGLSYNPYDEQDWIVEEGFLSTSYSLERALRFARGKTSTLMIIENLYGVNVTEYSMFPMQKEVIGLKNSMFRVDKVTKDKTKMKELFPELGSIKRKPTVVIKATYVHDMDPGNFQSTIAFQRQKSASFCNPIK